MSYYQGRINFQSPPAVTNLLIINVLVFLGMAVNPSADRWIMNALALYAPGTGYFRFWQPVTYMFLHGGFTHILFNMYALWMFGRILESSMGTRRFLTYYFITGVGAALIQMLVWHITGQGGATIGASGAIFGLLLAFGMMYPNAPLMLMFIPYPIKAKWFVLGYGLFELFFGVSGLWSGVAHFAHLGGMIFGFALLFFWKRTGKIYY